jgi:hypothetical protein
LTTTTIIEEASIATGTKRSSNTPTNSPSLLVMTTMTTTKKMKTDHANDDDNNNNNNSNKYMFNDRMPTYLASTNPTFEQKMNSFIQKSLSSINLEQLRHIAFIVYKLTEIELNLLLWSTYLRSGTGQINGNESHATATPMTTTTTALASHRNVHLWPDEVKTTMITNKHTTRTMNDIDHDSCLAYVHEILRQLREKSLHHQSQLQETKQALKHCFTLEMEDAVKQYVEHYCMILGRAHVNSKIAIVTYDYQDRLLELEFQEQTPYEYQLDLFSRLTLFHYEKEKAKCDLSILKHRLLYNHLPKSFNCLQLPLPISIDTITNETLRQRFTERCEKIFQRTKSDMMLVYIGIAEVNYRERAMKFDTELASVNDQQRTGPAHKKLTGTMMDLLHRRLRNTNHRLTDLYKLKLHFFGKAPTAANSI